MPFDQNEWDHLLNQRRSLIQRLCVARQRMWSLVDQREQLVQQHQEDIRRRQEILKQQEDWLLTLSPFFDQARFPKAKNAE